MKQTSVSIEVLNQVKIAVISCMVQNEMYFHVEKVLIQNIKERESAH